MDDLGSNVEETDERTKRRIATSEQPISVCHANERHEGSQFRLKYASFSICFCKKAGAHRHPEKSWEMHNKMVNAEYFKKGLGILFLVVRIVIKAFNNAVAKKHGYEP
ncbi:hypothetical protein BC830DRAFT_1174148 [Chytriomyces sp. MP71]|nr:hypothetical protein BC830DRAFT_1174148 [Chytriomyces sp. MP71]